MDHIEIWCVAPGYPAYMVSTLGNVKRVLPGKGATVGLVLCPIDNGHGYQKVNLRDNDGTHQVYIHCLVCAAFNPNTENKPQVDHRNGNRADNRAANLRWASRSENNRNRPSHAGSSSTYLGVCWDKRSRKWVSRIHVDGKSKRLGYFDSEAAAAIAYDAAARRFCGEFARCNFPDTTEEATTESDWNPDATSEDQTETTSQTETETTLE